MSEIVLLRVYVGSACYSFQDDVAKEAYRKIVDGIQSNGKIKYVIISENDSTMTILIIIGAITNMEKLGF